MKDRISHTCVPSRAVAAWLLAAPLLLALACASLLAGPAHAASAETLYQQGLSEFRALGKSSRAKYRDSWLKVGEYFQRAYDAGPNSSTAPKALYYQGRTWQELGKRSRLKADHLRAADYFQQVATRFATHSWADDALYRKALINLNRLKEPDLAYVDLLLIVHNHPGSDMAPQARRLLNKLEGDTTASGPSVPLPAQERAANPGKSAPVTVTSADNTLRPSKKKPGKARLNDVRHHSSSDYTRVVLDMTGEANYTYQLLKAENGSGRPHRLYLDLADTRLGDGVNAEMAIRDGILRSVRSGQFTPDTARVVLDFQDLTDFHVFALPNPFRLVVDVYGGAGAQGTTASGAATKRQHKPDAPLDPKAARAQLNTPQGSLIEQLGLTVRTVMIDAGHGGKDPGAVGNGLKEKHIALKLAKKVGQRLKKKGFNVLYTRDRDVFIPLDERTAMANVKKADMFISIHLNANRNRKVHGLEVYSLNLARTKDAARVAARENGVSERRISDLQVILTDLMLNTKVRESSDLASVVHRGVLRSVKRKYPLNDHGTRGAPFYVLMGAKMPAVLVEAGYITNRTEAKRLNNDHYQNYIADGIVAGIEAYKKKVEKYASL